MVKGRVAYVEQEAFILSDTFLENLLFGNLLDQVRLACYDKLIFRTDLKGLSRCVHWKRT